MKLNIIHTNLFYFGYTLYFLTCDICVNGLDTHLERSKRGASVYPVFPGGSGISGQNTFLFQYDSNPFIQYLGGGGSSGGSSGYGNSGGQQASNTYSFVAPAPQRPSYSFDQSQSGSYSLPVSAPLPSPPPPTYSSQSNSNSNPWQSNNGPSSTSPLAPSPSSSPYGSSFGSSNVPYNSYTTANFANSGSPAPSIYAAPAPSPHLHQLSATTLLHAAQSSAYSQNQLFDVLTEGSRPTSYKNGL